MSERSQELGQESARHPVPEAVIRWLRTFAGVALGALFAVAELLFLLIGGLAMLPAVVVPPSRPAITTALLRPARGLADLECWRMVTFTAGPEYAHLRDAARSTENPRTVSYLAARLLPGVLSALTLGLLGIGIILAVTVAQAAVTGELKVIDILFQLVIGAALLTVPVQVIANIAALDHRLASNLLVRTPRDALERRVSELTVSRAEVIAAVDAERQRIERDLHDGLQQRLVALGMLLGRAKRSDDDAKVTALVGQAHEDAQQAIDDLRSVAWRVYPSALEHAGLDEVLTMVAKQSSVPVKIIYELPDRPARPVETVLYFVACEAITNAAKHSGAGLITVTISRQDTQVEMRVHDDGGGGADPSGSGLRGLARRVEAMDGCFRIDSPSGGPTTMYAELPCE